MTILITGGTGFLGHAFTRHLLDTTDYDIKIYSRDEYKQWIMSSDLKTERIQFIIGDVRDSDRLLESCRGVDLIVHAAALKHVWAGEQHPWEVIQTNVHGTNNVVYAANREGARMVLVSSDKAVAPANLYGCTKMAAEALTINGGQRVVRYGNVFGSRGSVLHKFREWAAKGHIFKITDYRMTRFVITIEQAINLCLEALNMPPRNTLIPTLPAMRIVDLARAFDEDAVIEEIGIQPGEKLHESLSLDQSSEHARKLTIPEIKELISATV